LAAGDAGAELGDDALGRDPADPAADIVGEQRLPSGPAVMSVSWLLAEVPALNSVTTPSGVIRPIRLSVSSVNQRLPSGPAVML